jgi:predicted nucleic acid-binding protein
MNYFDATFLVKLHVREPGSELIAEMVQRRNEVIATSIIAKMEVPAALHRKYREGEMTHAAILRAQIYSNDKHLLAAAPIFKLKGINPLAK